MIVNEIAMWAEKSELSLWQLRGTDEKKQHSNGNIEIIDRK